MANAKDDKLADYRQKRDFRKTAEPSGQSAPSGGDKPIFVVHKHDASRLHYDLRLQIGDTLASWAVPKGPSLDPAQKRLAVHVEDHPLDYADFEGTIPENEYGGGTVMVWDCGTVKFKEEGKTPQQWLDEGHIEFELNGVKLKGQWVLIQTRMRGEAKNWLLRKRSGPHASDRGDVLADQPDSVKTGRSMEQIAAGAKPSAG